MNHGGTINDNVQQHMIDVVHAYVRALNAGDTEAIIALYADDATLEDPVGSPPRVGRAAIRDFYAATATMKLIVVLQGEIRVAEGACAFAFSANIVQHDKSTTIHPIDVFDFDPAGHIKHMRAYFGAPNIHD